MAVFDLHVHTVRGSSGSSLTPEQLTAGARAIGLDGVCLTEHSGGWEPDELRRVFQAAGILVIGALEVETDMGHVLVFGLHSYTDGMHDIGELRRAVERAGGVMVSAHPFRNLFNRPPQNVNLIFRDPDAHPKRAEEAASHPLFEVVDGIEVANGSNTVEENNFALEVARHRGLTGTGGSDAHSVHGLGNCVTVFQGDIRSEADLIEAIKAKAYSPVQGFHIGQPQTFGP